MHDVSVRVGIACALALASGCGDDGMGTAGSTTADPGTTGAGATTGPPPTSAGPAETTTGSASTSTSEGSATPTTGDGTTGGGDSSTTGAVAPPLPTGWVKRWPPDAVQCPDGYPISVEVHQGLLFVGTSCGEIFRSPDAGVTWENRSPGVNGPQVWGFVTRGELLFAAIRGAGVYRTDTLGDAWDGFSAGLSGFGPKGVLDIHRVGETLYIATFGGGVFASGLDVADWQPVNDETADPAKQSPTSTCPDTPGYLDPVTMLPMTFLHGFALTDDGTHLYYSNKCGGVYRTPLADLPAKSAWEGYGEGLPSEFSFYQDPFSLAYDGTYLYAGIDDEGGYRTVAGQPPAWTWVTETGLITGTLDILAWRVTADGIYIGARFGGAYFSADGASPWTQINTLPDGNLGGAADTIFGLAHDGQHLYAAAETGLYVSL